MLTAFDVLPKRKQSPATHGPLLVEGFVGFVGFAGTAASQALNAHSSCHQFSWLPFALRLY